MGVQYMFLHRICTRMGLTARARLVEYREAPSGMVERCGYQMRLVSAGNIINLVLIRAE